MLILIIYYITSKNVSSLFTYPKYHDPTTVIKTVIIYKQKTHRHTHTYTQAHAQTHTHTQRHTFRPTHIHIRTGTRTDTHIDNQTTITV